MPGLYQLLLSQLGEHATPNDVILSISRRGRKKCLALFSFLSAAVSFSLTVVGRVCSLHLSLEKKGKKPLKKLSRPSLQKLGRCQETETDRKALRKQLGVLVTAMLTHLYMEQILSSPPHATKLPEGAYAHVMTHEDRSGMAWTLFVL